MFFFDILPGEGGDSDGSKNQYLCIDLDAVRSSTVFGQEGCNFECCFSIWVVGWGVGGEINICALIWILFDQ